MAIPNSENILSIELRQSRIRELLMHNKQVSISRLAKEFCVSEMTIRRDLDKLEDDGKVRRIHGGAVPAERMLFEFNFHNQRQKYRQGKKAIAKKACETIKSGDRIIIDTGTTTLELVYPLKSLENITVITPSLAVASVLQFYEGIETILLGGVIRTGSPDLTGVVTEKNLEMFSVDIAFLGADGIGIDGTLYTDDMRIAKVDQEIRKRAQKVYVLSDSSKLGKTALTNNGSLKDIEALITDDRIDLEQKESLQNNGAKIITISA